MPFFFSEYFLISLGDFGDGRRQPFGGSTDQRNPSVQVPQQFVQLCQRIRKDVHRDSDSFGVEGKDR